MDNDKTTIGLTPADKELADAIMQKGWFKDKVDLARFAMSFAIKEGTKPSEVEGAETVWNVGTLDPDGELRSIIPVLFPTVNTPYRVVEYFIHVGLRLMTAKLEDPTNNLQNFFI